jgi:AhpD family alkylhydroperoxidase
MSRIPLPEGDADEVIRAMGLSPAFGNAMATLSGAIYGDILLSMREREAIRMRVAQLNQCPICLQWRFPELANQGVTENFYNQVDEWQNSDEFSNREQLAIEYTELYLKDHLSISDNFFAKLNQDFSPEEIFEMSAIIGGLMANGRLLAVLKLDQQCSIPSLADTE